MRLASTPKRRRELRRVGEHLGKRTLIRKREVEDLTFTS
jgi:hypothetical protein